MDEDKTLKISVREERPDDAPAIDGLLRASFDSPAEADLVRALKEGDALVVSFVAEIDDEFVGYVAFSPVRIGGFMIGVGLAPVCVHEDFRNRGVAHRLIEAGIEMARGLGYANAVVLGDPKYYGRFGFAPAEKFSLSSVYDAGDAFQALELRKGGMPPEGGLVEYAPAFAEL